MDGEASGGERVKKGVAKCYILNCHIFVTRCLYKVGVYFRACDTRVEQEAKWMRTD
jgi:hypothetical protein